MVIKLKITDLIDFGKKSLILFDSYIKENNIKPPIRYYIKHSVVEFNISEKKSNVRHKPEFTQDIDWTMIIYDFLEKELSPQKDFKNLNKLIVKHYKKNINKIAPSGDETAQAALWLKNYTQALIIKKIDGTLTDDIIIEYSSTFKSELELGSILYKYIYYLNGLFIDSNSININDNVIIRKTKKEDLEYKRDILIDMPGSKYIGIPTSILEFEILEKEELKCKEYINRIQNSLRLYKLSSVYPLRTLYLKSSIIWPSLAIGGENFGRYSSYGKYTIKKSEINTFVDFINKIEKMLNFDRENKRHRSLSISIGRYNSALLEIGDMGRKLMTAVMGLESLFTLEKDRGENSFKLGIRVAKLLGYLNYDAEEVRQKIEEAYNYRNKYVHGSYISQDIQTKINKLFPLIMNYLRVSLIIFLFKNKKIGKDNMIHFIDKSTVNESKNNELKHIIIEEFKEFKSVLI
jgi:hypothetical protein